MTDEEINREIKESLSLSLIVQLALAGLLSILEKMTLISVNVQPTIVQLHGAIRVVNLYEFSIVDRLSF